MSILSRLGLHRWSFTLSYLRGRTPWDTSVTPPELVEAVEGAQALPAGRALDIGCGTGTNSIYLARHGWHVTGIDFAAPAIARAKRKARAAGAPPGTVRFVRGSATQLGALVDSERYDLLFDLGCLHTIPAEQRPAYASGLAACAAPDALYMLYAFAPRQIRGRTIGITDDEVHALFTPAFTIERAAMGSDRGMPSTWYWLRRIA